MAGYWDMKCAVCHEPTACPDQTACPAQNHRLTEKQCDEFDPHWREYILEGDPPPQTIACAKCSRYCVGCDRDVCAPHFTGDLFCSNCNALLLSKRPSDLYLVRDKEKGQYRPIDDKDRWSRGRTALEMIVMGQVAGQTKLTHFYPLHPPEQYQQEDQ